MVKVDYKKSGFSLLELVIAIFLISIVIGATLLLIAGNLRIIHRANEMMVATALAQYNMEEIKNFDFPPVYYDKQGFFGDRVSNSGIYKRPDEIDPVNDGTDRTPDEFKDRFIVKRFDFRYDSSGNFIENVTDDTSEDTDKTMLHRIDIYILRKKDNSVMLKNTIYISRNGMF